MIHKVQSEIIKTFLYDITKRTLEQILNQSKFINIQKKADLIQTHQNFFVSKTMYEKISTGIRVIINADDFGYCIQRDTGILQLIQCKAISSISVMVNGPSIVQSSEKLKNLIENMYKNDWEDNLSIGLHLNFTQFKNICNTHNTDIDVINEKGIFKGKSYFYENIQKIVTNKQNLKFFQQETKMQLTRFLEIFNFRPSHIDGHNHIHVIPQIAQIMAQVMSLNGIYHTRVPIPQFFDEKAQQTQLHTMNKIFISNAKLSETIFKQRNIVYSNYLLGLQNMGKLLETQKIAQRLKRILQIQKNNRNNVYVQIMVHPGYPQNNYQSIFSGSQQRKHQLQVLQSNSFKNMINSFSNDQKLSNYNQIKIQEPKLSVLIYSKLVEGSGNLTTSKRLGNILQSIGFDMVYFLNVPQKQNSSRQTIKIRNMIQQLNIKLMIGINLTRTAIQMFKALNMPGINRIVLKIPYILVIAGTDANITFSQNNQNQMQKSRYIQPIKQSLNLISLSYQMKQKMTNFLKKHNIQKEITLISQSNCIKSINTISQMKHNFQRPYILFPTSFRKVKDVSHIFKELNIIINQKNIDVLLFGPIINHEYFEESVKNIGKIKYMCSVKHLQYLGYLKNAYMVINCSQSQGMSCSILQALGFGIPVIARKNEGNLGLIQHKINGYIYESGQDFLKYFQQLRSNYKEIKDSFNKKNEIKFNKQFSFDAQKQAYRCLLQNSFFPLLYNFNISKSSIHRLISLPEVHSISQTNIKIMQKIVSQNQLDSSYGSGWTIVSTLINSIGRHQTITILDIGCGCGIFCAQFLYDLGLKIIQNKLSNPLNVCIVFSDIDKNALKNVKTNLQQLLILFNKYPFNMCFKIKSIQIVQSSMFQGLTKHLKKFDIILANLPQSPFQSQNSRIDKNAGRDSLKWHKQFLQNLHHYIKDNKYSFSVVLYSHMAQPNIYKQLVANTHNRITWISSAQTHIIHRSSYDKMEEGLANFIQNFYNQGKADIRIQKDIFYVPADLRIIQKDQ